MYAEGTISTKRITLRLKNLSSCSNCVIINNPSLQELLN